VLLAGERQKSCCFSKAVLRQSLTTHFFFSLARSEKGNTEISFEDLAQSHAEVPSKTPQVSPLWSELLTAPLPDSSWSAGAGGVGSPAKPMRGAAPPAPQQQHSPAPDGSADRNHPALAKGRGAAVAREPFAQAEP